MVVSNAIASPPRAYGATTERYQGEMPMPKKDASLKLNRRKFLTAAAVAGASGAVNPAKAATAADPQQRLPSALPPNAHVAAAATGSAPLPSRDNGTPGSDFMVDVIKTLDIKYLPANPA